MFVAVVATVSFGCVRDGNEAEEQPQQVVTGQVGPATGGLPSVVILEPQAPLITPTTTPDLAVMDQFGIAFIPALLVVQKGQQVEFRNSEDVAHTVRLVDNATDSTLFNVATSIGDPHQHTFERTGMYAVLCDIHPAMRAVILVVSTAYYVVADDSGVFSLEGVPAGNYKLSVWNADSSLGVERIVQVTRGHTTLRLN